jgi:hypothetical protein
MKTCACRDQNQLEADDRGQVPDNAGAPCMTALGVDQQFQSQGLSKKCSELYLNVARDIADEEREQPAGPPVNVPSLPELRYCASVSGVSPINALAARVPTFPSIEEDSRYSNGTLGRDGDESTARSRSTVEDFKTRTIPCSRHGSAHGVAPMSSVYRWPSPGEPNTYSAQADENRIEQELWLDDSEPSHTGCPAPASLEILRLRSRVKLGQGREYRLAHKNAFLQIFVTEATALLSSIKDAMHRLTTTGIQPELQSKQLKDILLDIESRDWLLYSQWKVRIRFLSARLLSRCSAREAQTLYIAFSEAAGGVRS